MNFHPTLTMRLGPILIQKILCLMRQTTWMTNHVTAQFLQTGVVSQQITLVLEIILEILVLIRVALCLSEQIIQQNAMITRTSEDLANIKPQNRWEIQNGRTTSAVLCLY